MIIHNIKPNLYKLPVIRNTNIKVVNLLNKQFNHKPNLITKMSLSHITTHALTDIYYENFNEIFRKYLISYAVVSKLSPAYRFYILLLSSIFHIRNDIGLLNSVLLHVLWIVKPITSITYLSFIHVPMHYIKAINNNIPIEYVIFLNLLSFLLNFFPLNKIKDISNLWWVWLVLGHVLVTK
jgi:hypothetical protein